MKNIIVFGGSGFLGSHVADKLTQSGYSVTIFDKVKSKYLQQNQTMLQGDILNKEEVDDAINNNDFVYNFAGLADIEDSKKDPIGTVKQNILGNSIILESSVKNNIKRYIFGSTVYVYSNLGSFYRISKQACENYIEHYKQVLNLNYTILRFGSLYGPRSDIRNGIYRFIYQAFKNKKIEWSGSKDALREFIHVQDAADCAVKIIEEKYANQHLILTGHQSITINNLFIMIQEILKNQNISFNFSESLDSEHYKTTPYIFNPKFAKKLSPDEYIDLGQGLTEMAEQISENINNEKK
tara:strand:+ start:1048 stop:1935 length:888 start_codon:yes stop_codon:yes gene_type:complete